MSQQDPTANLSFSHRLKLRRRNWEHRGRNLLLAVLRGILRVEHGKAPNSLGEGAGSLERILLIRTGKALGDVVMACVLVAECRRLFPNARVDFLSRSSAIPLLQAAGVDQTWEFPSNSAHVGKLLKLLGSLRRRKYQMVIACDNPFKSSFTTCCLALWTRAPFRVGFENSESASFLNVRVTPQKGRSMIANLLELLAPFGKIATSAVPRLKPSAEAMQKADGLVPRGISPVLIFIPSHWRKSWPLDLFLGLAEKLIREGEYVLLAWGPKDPRMQDPRVWEWVRKSAGQGTILEPQQLDVFLSVLSRCSLFVSNDCGPYHMAVAVGIPTVGAFISQEACDEFGYHEEGRRISTHVLPNQEGMESVFANCLKIKGKAAKVGVDLKI
jgi:heptosyltransferase II